MYAFEPIPPAPSPSAAPGAALVVELSPWALALPRFTRRTVLLVSLSSIVLGSMLLGLVAVMVVLIVFDPLGVFDEPPPVDLGFGGAFLTFVGVLGVWVGIRALGMLRGTDARGDGTLERPDHAFTVVDGRIELPSAYGRPAESWPLAETTVVIRRRSDQDSMRITAPGRRPRVFLQRVLARPVAETAARIDALRAAAN